MPFCLIIASGQPSQALLPIATQAGQALKGLYPEHTLVRQDWGWCSVLAAQPLADRRSVCVLSADGGQCLVSAGGWFYAEQLASGQEPDLLACLQAQGFAGVLANLEGVFALAWFDKQAGRVDIAVDPAGSYHVYRMQLDGLLLVSDSALTLAALAQARLSPEGVRQFVATGVIYGEHSIWENLAKLPAAGHLTAKVFEPAVSCRTYWDFQQIQPNRYTAGQAAEKIAHGLTVAAQTIDRHFPKALCDLTGGYDSRATLSGFLLAKVSVATTVSGSETSPDAQVAALIAGRFGLPHRRVERKTGFTYEELHSALLLTDGEFDVFEYANIARTHRGHVAAGHDISINGSFGELARAYWWELLFPNIGAQIPLDAKMLARKRFAAGRYDSSIFAGAAAQINLVESLAQLIDRQNRPVLMMPNTTQMDHAYFSMRMQRWQGRIASSTNRIWPAVSPFAFRPILQPVLEAKTNARLRNVLIRTLFANHLPALGQLPLEHGYPAMPATLGTIHQFAPLVAHYGSRVADRLTRQWQKNRPAQMPAQQPYQLTDGPLAELLAVPHLSASGLFAPERLGQFMLAPEHQFSSEQWRRLLTLEMAVAKVAALNSK